MELPVNDDHMKSNSPNDIFTEKFITVDNDTQEVRGTMNIYLGIHVKKSGLISDFVASNGIIISKNYEDNRLSIKIPYYKGKHIKYRNVEFLSWLSSLGLYIADGRNDSDWGLSEEYMNDIDDAISEFASIYRKKYSYEVVKSVY
ncbi:unnamed protein product [marine sediment metagenome]|uniref:Uncharacterized protein n=1 Tax=marine sediment metagenome TaxID=412755 RepID=X0ZPA1_9ZZZZ